MERVIFISEIVGAFGESGAETQVWASADAEYDRENARVFVHLQDGTRHALTHTNGQSPAWLPGPQTVSEHLAREEAIDFARDVFHGWARRVRTSIPRDLDASAAPPGAAKIRPANRSDDAR